MAAKPLHLAIIADGNRRWAKAQGWLPWKGHEYALQNFHQIVDWCRADGRIGTLTIWGFSTENWKRESFEVEKLMSLFEQFMVEEREDLIRDQIRFTHTGRRDRIPASLAQIFAECEEETKSFTGFGLNLAIDYGGRDEVTRAVRKLTDPKNATEDMIRSHLDHPEIPDIDLIIRTSGEQRTSNFFLWQSTYAEWFFIPTHFPELSGKEIDECLVAFEKRSRRFGGG